MEKRAKFFRIVKKIIYWGLVVAFFWFVNKYFADIEEFVEVMQTANYKWFVMALFVSLSSMAFLAILNRSAAANLGFRETSILGAIQNHFAVIFVSVINPTSGWGGVLYYGSRYSEKSPRSLGGSVVAILLTWVIYNFWAAALMAPALYLLSNYNSYVMSLGIIAYILFTLEFFVISLSFLFGDKKPMVVNKYAYKLSNRFWKEGGIFALSSNPFEVNIRDYCLSSKSIAQSGRKYLNIVIGTFGVHVMQIVSLIMIFAAFGAEVTPIGVIMCYSLFILFTTISPTPQGIGIVEGLVQIAMTSIGYSSGESLAIILAYRGITLWIPLLIGFILFKKINLFDKREEKDGIASSDLSVTSS